jgi:transposase
MRIYDIGDEMTLIEALKKLKTKRQKGFILLCVAGLSIEEALTHYSVSVSSYFRWKRDPQFREVLDNLPELHRDYADEAISLLRLRNIAEVLTLEDKVLNIVKEELRTGKYNLLKTHLTREIFSRAKDERHKAKKQEFQQTWSQRLRELGLMEDENKKESKETRRQIE